MMPTSVPRKPHMHLVALSANGKQVYADLMSKQLASDISSNPRLLRLAEEVIGLSTIEGPKAQLEYDMGQDIGRSDRVETSEKDVIFYARETKAGCYTRFVKNRQATPTGCITVNLVQDGDDGYEITNIWIGKTFPATPDSDEATDQSQAYWENHAVIYNGQPIITSTLTKTSPY